MKETIKTVIRPLYYFLKIRYFYYMGKLFPSKIRNFKDIPIIVNNRNRLTFLKELIESLEVRGYNNIYIIDNASTYEPLLEFYENCKYKVFRLNENVGFLALWETGLYKHFYKDYYVYTDSDVVPIKSCPDDFLDFFVQVLRKHKFVQKVGFSLKIDDIPDCFQKKEEVIQWEAQFYEKKLEHNLYLASIDTTFALYRPRTKGPANKYVQMVRTGYPYAARHLPWYVNSSFLSDEEQFYIDHAKTSTHWTVKNNPKSWCLI